MTVQNPSLPNKRRVGTGYAMTRGLILLVGRREEGAEKLDEATLVLVQMEIESSNNFLSREAQIRWTVPTAAWFI
jgi:hypothetical protein